MFDFGDLYVPWNTEKIKAQQAFLQTYPAKAYWRRGRLVPHAYDDTGRVGLNIQFHKDEAGPWLIYQEPDRPNAFYKDNDNIVTGKQIGRAHV